jgi:hypothetical protein
VDFLTKTQGRNGGEILGMKYGTLTATWDLLRRIGSRWEYHEANFLGMLQLGCLVILLRHL